jgi:hypothetical protein
MIIGISGKANAGKDTLAEWIQIYSRRVIKIDWEIKSFAYNVKHVASILTGLPVEFMITRAGKAAFLSGFGMTGGALQQKIGEGIRNTVHENAWVMALLSGYKASDDPRWIIPDVRYQNEARAIRALGGMLVRVNRDAVDDCGRDPNHSSEIDLDNWTDWDFVIQNDGTLNDLKNEGVRIAVRAERILRERSF